MKALRRANRAGGRLRKQLDEMYARALHAELELHNHLQGDCKMGEPTKAELREHAMCDPHNCIGRGPCVYAESPPPDELEHLTRWKQEAIEVITEWEKVYDALGKPGQLGKSKAAASVAEVTALRSQLDEAVRLLHLEHDVKTCSAKCQARAFLVELSKEGPRE